MYRIGTSCYRSLIDLQRADPWSWKERLEDGSVSVGKPLIKEGEKLLVDSDGRYHIEVKQHHD